MIEKLLKRLDHKDIKTDLTIAGWFAAHMDVHIMSAPTDMIVRNGVRYDAVIKTHYYNSIEECYEDIYSKIKCLSDVVCLYTVVENNDGSCYANYDIVHRDHNFETQQMEIFKQIRETQQ